MASVVNVSLPIISAMYGLKPIKTLAISSADSNIAIQQKVLKWRKLGG
jgi:hypothetical protein